MGRFDEAMAHEPDPLSPAVSMAMTWIYNWSRQQDKAIAELRKTLELEPNFIPAHSRSGVELPHGAVEPLPSGTGICPPRSNR